MTWGLPQAVTGGLELTELFNDLKKGGIEFKYTKNGSKTTNH